MGKAFAHGALLLTMEFCIITTCTYTPGSSLFITDCPPPIFVITDLSSILENDHFFSEEFLMQQVYAVLLIKTRHPVNIILLILYINTRVR